MRTASHPAPFTWTLRLLQVLGSLLAMAGLGGAAFLLQKIQPDMATYSASALGLALVFIVLPLLGFAALLLLPSTALLCLPAMRARFRVQGGWFALWCANLACCALFLGAGVFVLWVIWMGPKIGP
ncbi:apolipoprotein N-acyltransferase [Paucibacter oligotrophus]|uniref:Apolipoprotein N-acyltransferase n=1 Tax=Roseateles oligotrophus TaxID=1769250 RepID=A0A840LDE1_9BURK|nr:hypothetical protein [Roseateles oligotrophus]MBB4844652.1 apolipoprotein N-acyltransferase [Roseateles oligotrophus]